MKILWLINIPLPEASLLMNEKPVQLGGWLMSTSQLLSGIDGVELSIAFPKKGIKGYSKLFGKNIKYYVFQEVRDNNKKILFLNPVFMEIINDSDPDIVHIHGTEMAQSLSMLNTCNNKKVSTVVSIQGMVSIIAKHVLADLPVKVIYCRTLRNIILKDSVIGLRKIFTNRGKNEIETIKKAGYVIGRTTWDKACCSQINPGANYYCCNETLRDEFYKHTWSIDYCENYSVFLSQGHYPVKGLHYVIEALAIILKEFPDTRIYIGGKNILGRSSLKSTLSLTYYNKYIRRLIKRYNVESNVIFTGHLDEKQMCQQYLRANVFVSASTIENESNSLSEAKLLGVPCVASYVGGVIDRITHGVDGYLYQHDAPYMLAYYVCEIFRNKELALKFSENAREHALKVNNREENLNTLLTIYNEIC